MSDVDVDIDGIWPCYYCVGEAQCALGSLALKDLDSINDTLAAQGMKVREMLADVPELSLPDLAGVKSVFHQFVLHFDGSAFDRSRNDLLDLLTKEYKIRAIVQYYPLYRYPLFQKMGFGGQDCPVLENWWDNSFSFPWCSGMTDETIDYLVDSTKAAINKLKSV